MINRKPVLTTIGFGLIAAVWFIVMSWIPTVIMPKFIAFRLAIWVCIAGYALLLKRWAASRVANSRTRAESCRGGVGFLLILPVFFSFMRISDSGFLLLSAAILSWLRSGVYFPGSRLRSIIAESMISFGSLAVIACFTPNSALMWALAVWLFFLIQSVYFIVFENVDNMDEEETVGYDPFEKAKKQVEDILADIPK